MRRWGGELGKTGNRRRIQLEKKLLDMIKGRQAWGFVVRGGAAFGLARVQSARY